MNNQNQPQKVTRKILDSRDFEHLIRGGTIAIGNAEFALADIGYTNMQEIIFRADTDGKTRLREVRRFEE